jgi:hypothetical protein
MRPFRTTTEVAINRREKLMLKKTLLGAAAMAAVLGTFVAMAQA